MSNYVCDSADVDGALLHQAREAALLYPVARL